MANLYYKFFRTIARMIWHKREVIRETPSDDEASIYVCNHSGPIGPVNMTLYFDKPARPWIISYIFDDEISPNFVFHDFFFGRSKKLKKGWRVLAKLVSKLLKPLLTAQDPIYVYKNSIKIKDTFKESVETLKSGKEVIIYPESHIKNSKFVNEMCDGFADTAYHYYKETGKCVKFYPTYVGNGLKTINVGNPVTYNPENSNKEERKRIALYCQKEIDRIAHSLPEHKPLPFVTEDFYQNYGEFVGNDVAYWQFVSRKRSE